MKILPHADTGARRVVCHIINDLDKGGAETMLWNLLMTSERFTPIVISLKPGGFYKRALAAAGVAVVSVNMFHPLACLPACWKIRRTLRRSRPAVVQGWMYIGNLAALLLTAVGRVKSALVWNIRHSLTDYRAEGLLTRWTILANRFFSRRPDAIIYNSAVSAGQHERFGFARRPTTVIPNGFDLERFRFNAESRTRRRAALQVGGRCCLLGVVGRFHPHKDHANFLAAAGRLRGILPEADWRGLLIGRRFNRNNTVIAELLLRFGVADRVLLVEETDEVPEYLSAIDVLCLPSASESFPNVVGEAMAAGVPCVVTDVGEAALIVGETGIVVPPKDPVALAQGLARLVRRFQDDGPRRDEAARRRIEANFSLPAVTRRYEALYEALAGRRAKGKEAVGE